MPSERPKQHFLAALQDHAEHIRNYSVGIDEELWGTSSTASTSFPPFAHWTSGDKRLFFYALTRYSRFRPDLIAACIKTKNSVEVSVFINALDSASHRISTHRNNHPPAIEMSEAWVAFEEHQASLVTRLEKKQTWQTESVAEQPSLIPNSLPSMPSPGPDGQQRTHLENSHKPLGFQRHSSPVLNGSDLKSLNRALMDIDKIEREKSSLSKSANSDTHPLAHKGLHGSAVETILSPNENADTKSKFSDLGLDHGAFIQDGLNILSLRRVTTLLRARVRSNRTILFGSPSCYGLRSPNALQTAIHYSVLRRLRIYLERFLRAALHHIITRAEIASQTRSGKKVFGKGLLVKEEHVIGASRSSHPYLLRIPAHSASSESDGGIFIHDVAEGNKIPAVAAYSCPLPHLSEIQPALIAQPSVLALYNCPDHLVESRYCLGTASELSILGDNMHDTPEQLAQELEEEDALERQDQALSRTIEPLLWAMNDNEQEHHKISHANSDCSDDLDVMMEYDAPVGDIYTDDYGNTVAEACIGGTFNQRSEEDGAPFNEEDGA